MKYLPYISFAALLLILPFTLAAQQNKAVGHFYDYEGKPIDGYIGTDYKAQTDLSIIEYKSTFFVKGTYYDLSGQGIEGLIKFNPDNNYFQFRKNLDVKSNRISSDECIGLIMQKDSFLVINNFTIDGNILTREITSPKFAQVIESFDNRTYYKYINTVNGMLVSYYLYKDNDKSEIKNFSKNKKHFPETAIEAFSKYPALIQAIKTNEYIEADILQLIKRYKYKLAFNDHAKIYLDNQFNDLFDEKQASYYLKIDEIKKESFKISYFTLEGQKINTSQFSSIFPFEREGTNIWYHSNGKKRKEIDFKANEPQNIQLFDFEGKKSLTYNFNLMGIPYFTAVMDENNKNILDESGNGIASFYDQILNRNFENTYKDHQLVSSYYLDDENEKIYLRAERNSKLKAENSLKVKLAQSFQYPVNSINKGNEGIVYVKCVIDEKGLTKSLEVIKGIDSEIDQKILNLLDFTKTYKQWKPAKMDKNKIISEVIIPVQVILQSYNPYRYNNLYWMDHHMFMQNMQMQFTPPTPPTIPSFN